MSAQVPVSLSVRRPARVSSLALGQVWALVPVLVLAAEAEHPPLSLAAVVAVPVARRAPAPVRTLRPASSSMHVGAALAACKASAALGSHRLPVQACRPRKSRRSTTRCTQAHQ